MLTLNIDKIYLSEPMRAPMDINEAIKWAQRIASDNEKTVRLIFGGCCILVPIGADTEALLKEWCKLRKNHKQGRL